MTVARPQEIAVMAMFDFFPARWVASQRRKKFFLRREDTAVLEEAMAKKAAQEDGEKAGGKEGGGMGFEALLGVHGDANDPTVLLVQTAIAPSSCSLDDFANIRSCNTVCQVVAVATGLD
jgi:hypothetical protein